MLRRILKISGWTVFTVSVLFLVALAAVAIWASTGPRDVSEYTPYVENSINQSLPDNKIKVGSTQISWGGFDELLVIRTNNVEFFDHTGNLIAVFPQVTLRYGVTSLLTGNLIPSRVRLNNPRIDLSWLKNEQSGESVDFRKIHLGKLRHVTIKNGSLVTPQSGEWVIDEANLWRGGQHLFIESTLHDNNGQNVVTSLRASTNSDDKLVSATLTNFKTETLRPYFPEFEGINLTVNGTGGYHFDSTKQVANFNIESFSGEVENLEVFREKINVKQALVKGTYDFISNTLVIEDLQSEFKDGFKLSAVGTIVDMKALDLRANFGALSVENLSKYWPVPTAKNALAWVSEHIYGGQMTSGKLAVNITPEEADGTVKMDKNSVNFKFNITGVNSNYSDKFMPVENVSATGFIDADSVTLDVKSGKLGKSAVKSAKLAMTGIDTPSEILSMNVKVEGAAEDLADFYIKAGSGKKIIKNATDLVGISSSDINLKLPLLKDLKLDDVKYNIRAEIANATGKNVLDKVNVEKLRVMVAADNNSYEAKGDCFATLQAGNAEFSLKNAPISFQVASKGNNLNIAVGSDITNSAITIAPLDINKQPGEAGKLLVELNDNGTTATLKRLELSSSSINVSAKGTLAKDYSGIGALDIARLQFGKTSLSGKISGAPYLSVDLKGDTLDAQPLIKYMKSKKDESEDNTEYQVKLEAGQILLMNGESLKNAFVNLHCAKDCDVISINSQNVSISQTSTSLVAKAADAGVILNGFDIYDNMKGGLLEIKADVSGSSYRGKLFITDFSIAKAKILEKMLTIGSLTGIADTLRGKGIRFKKLSSDFELDKKKIKVKEFRMVGPAIGITANGEINRKTDIADLSGNIIPAYTANTLLGKIPLIGEVIIGDDGVFALAYSMKGNVEDPEMSVNPLSVLAPGFLKNVFQ